MFDTLEEQIKRDDGAEVTPKQRWMRRLLVVVLSAVLFGALYSGIRMLE